MIEFKNIMKSYGDSVALKNINLKIDKGELVALIGPSGCGKTTTMRMVNRLTEPTKGQIFINGQNISEFDPVELRRNIGYIIQEIGLFPHMTIEDNVSLVLRLKKVKAENYLERVDELLKLVGLDPETFKKRTPHELSGGQQQRIGVIRALAADPDIILMDEPFSALDPISREQLQDDIMKLQKEIQKTIVFVTHDMDEAIKIADRIAIMNEGEIVQIDTPENIIKHPANDFVKGFIGQDRLEQHQTTLTASDLLLPELITASPDQNLVETLELMRENNIENLYITNASMELLGLATYEKVSENILNTEMTVADIMETENILTLNSDDSITEVAKRLQNTVVDVIPIIKDNKFAGIVTRSSMIRGIAESNQVQGVDE